MTKLHDSFRELFTDMQLERRICRIDKSEFADDPEKTLRRGTITEEEIENLSKY